jgi:hypothetical protein
MNCLDATDHKPTDADESARIASLGGFVGRGRVNGTTHFQKPQPTIRACVCKSAHLGVENVAVADAIVLT